MSCFGRKSAGWTPDLRCERGQIPVRVGYYACECLRPLMLRLPRGGYRVYSLLGGRSADEAWRDVPRRHRVFYDRALKAYVHVDLGDWMGREHYYCGSFDLANRLLIDRLLGRGDTYVDIGANRGILSLCASRKVGPEGRVFSFEPNPATFALLERHLTLNGCANCTAHNMGLSDEPGTMTLSSPEEHSGTSTFRPVVEAFQQTSVAVQRGDAVLAPEDLRGKTLFKIDTEGFEFRVLRGLEGLLDRARLAFSVEVTDAWLRQAGGSAAALFDWFRERGFQPWFLSVRGKLWGWQLDLRPLSGPVERHQYDVVFTRGDEMGLE